VATAEEAIAAAQAADTEEELDALEEGETRTTVLAAIEKRREELAAAAEEGGGDGEAGPEQQAGDEEVTVPEGQTEEQAKAVAAQRDLGALVGPPGFGEEGGPTIEDDAAPLSGYDAASKRTHIEIGPDGRAYQVRQVRTD
jgi:hypothetical protein